ncbi:heavy-metal-associated domain-containing protein [Polaribacter cellanae]|uniref:Cation transporter n=1 Tax=Polaribacter cellanae TaxID=2818493 RepID=A0A975CRQ5_9FLAO|nr:cation transporter [Polaribacter cellanae]QTE24130.1 cation transporter [Polaribacter cellanae]
MRIQKIVIAVVIASFTLVGCKSENTKTTEKTEVVAAKQQMVALHISGMTCEIGCAKTIQSKLSKKEGVLEAKVIFKDSVANIQFDANKTSKKDLIAFVDGIAGGDLYKATEASE